MRIIFTNDNPVVNEDEGTITVCVERVGLTTQDITIELVASESTPADAIGKSY